MADVRPMRADDVAGADRVKEAAFQDLARRLQEPVPPPGDPEASHVRLRRLLATDPGGCWVADDGDGLVGVGLALMRDGVWGLSLLAVRPDCQSAGIGGALLRRTLEYGADARGGIILGSPDARALRAYAGAGFDLHPALWAVGRPEGAVAAPAVRAFEPGDHALAAAIDAELRGAPHGADLDALAAAGCELLTFPGHGYAAHRDGAVKTIAAFDDEAAAALLRTVLARVPDGAEADVGWLTGAQQWAIDVVLAARLALRPGGAVCLRGEVGRFRPYLPSGAFL